MRLLAFVTVTLLAAAASAADPRAEYDAKIRAELEAQNPSALETWDRANALREQRDAGAADLYSWVTELAPKFHHAQRRRCGMLLHAGRVPDAIAACRAAMAIAEAAPENVAMLGSALARSPDPSDQAEAKRLAARVLAMPDTNANNVGVVCESLVALGDLPLLERCSDQLAKVDPDGMGTHFVAAIVAASNGQWDDAERALARARAAGLPPDAADPIAAAIAANRPSWPGYLRLAAWIAGLWIGLLLVLLIAGTILGTITLRTAEQSARSGTADATPQERRLRRVYAAVIGLTSAYFYLSIPILLLLVVGTGGGIIYGFIALGRIPIKLVLVVGLLVLVTVWAIVKSLFVRSDDTDPGVRLNLDTEPKLRAALHDVAARIGTAPVDNVYMTVGTDIAVTERGGMWRRLRGRTERCLILGVGVLDGMKLRDFEAILGHEYGHLRNEDTAGGGVALAVRRSLFSLIIGLAHGGAATWYNPAWWFVRGYLRVFERVSQGASRLQEILADRWAAIAYGAEAFERGLRHVIARAVRFDAHANHALNEVIEAKRPLANLYAYRPEKPLAEEQAKEIDERIQAAIDREPSAYDSHPAPRQRFALLHALGVRGTAPVDDAADAWSLFASREALERRLTDEVRKNVAASSDVHIRAA